ncbi:DEAD/DEAH box helicase [Undibacter mobilis]|uniref:ATP-dependent helicase n=1 Tax=Undibacter mobilis TaxID=2292256 RepID=A0A371B3B4_9BRAD|nr:DEAD/DEAH box helicase [Undibacter mobilis]RDV02075.1 ATP-dependent helicase [Undibacter mobilis]
MTFMPDSPQIARALAERNYTQPTPVQKAVLADDAVGRDLLVSAQTGSGKTVAYGLAFATDLLGGAERFGRSGKPLALIVAPTRELAIQVQRELTWFYQYCGARVVSCVGGMDPRREQRELADGAHIVVGTPGRLCDHLRRNRLDLSELKAIVLDEADEMLNLGFREDMEFLLEATPQERRTLLFSATLPRGIVALAKQYQKDAFRVEVLGDESGHADIEYRAIRVAAHDSEHAVVNILRFYEAPSTIVFCNTRHAVRHLQAALLERGFLVVALSGELTQNERTTALQSLRDGRARVCVATDVAARGIDLPNLGLVIHAELPNDPEVMQHRSGRTGRAGRKGISVLLVPNSRRRRVEMFFKQAGVNAVWAAAPQADEIRKLDQQRMMQDELFTDAPTDEDLALARTLLAEKSAEAIAAALARLYRARLPSPEDIIDPGSDRGVRFRDERNDRPYARDRESPAGDDTAPRETGKRASFRRPMEGGSVWFKASVGRRKNAEARWLLPMICRRGGIAKGDIGAIKIYDTVTEFEISGKVADTFATKVQAPDAEENIRIEPLPQGPQGGSAPSTRDERSAPAKRPDKKADKPHFKKRQQEHKAAVESRERDDKPNKKPDFKKGDFKRQKFKKSKKEKHRHQP